MIVDLALARMSGRELLLRLRGTEWGHEIPVLLLTGWERAERFSDQADAVLSKCAEPVSIRRTVDRLAIGRRPVDVSGGRLFERRAPQRIGARREPQAARRSG